MQTTPRHPDPRSRLQIQEAFLEAYMEHVTITKACDIIGYSRKVIYEWFSYDTQFKQAFDEAKKIAIERLEDEAHRRAFEGIENPVYQKGEFVGFIREYSDSLIQFLLKGHKPKIYGTDRQELSGPGGGPIQTQDVTVNIEL